MTEQEGNYYCKFCCVDCFAYVESECFCDRILGFDAETGYPIVDVTEDDEAYLYNGVSQVGDDHIKTEDTCPASNTENTTCNEVRPLTLADDRISEKGIVDNYCIECSKFIEDEDVSYYSNGHPVVHHNNGHKHGVMFGTDIQRLLEFGTSWLGQSTRYETAEMYGISVEKLDQILAHLGGDL
jgi:hypothetical protein